ncbi:hypothetical protein ABPG74_019332 [Tetrahymena malaccensis]
MGGINSTFINDIHYKNCTSVQLISLKQSSIGVNTIQNSYSIQIVGIIIEDITSSNQQPLIYLINQFSIIKNLTALNLSLNNHFIQQGNFQIFQISNSSFQNIQYHTPSTTIFCQQGQNLEIQKVQFSNISSTAFSAVLLVKQMTQVSILSSQFIRNQNLFRENQQSNLDIHGIANLQSISQLSVNSTIFNNNTSFGFGGAMFLLQVSTSIVYNSTFITNKALNFSGGAIYLNQSRITLLGSIFQNNLSFKERGGGLCSENSILNINQSQIIGNTAIIGGGIYYNQYQSLFIDLNSKLFNNTGQFYGNNIGSFPVKLLNYNKKTNQYNQYIKIQNFQSGNYTKNPIYVQLIDEEDRIISLDIDRDSNLLSDSILQEIQNYQIEIQAIPNQKDLVIIQGNQLQYIKELNLFQLNITAGYTNNPNYQLDLVSQFSKQTLKLDLELDFRKCKIGEIRQKNQGFIQCYECQSGTYSLTDPYEDEKNIDSLQCLKCPQQYASDCYKDLLILKDNYWRESNTTDLIYPCQKNGCSETNENQINGCIKGYIGPLCDSCDYKGEYWNVQYALNENNCVQCDQINFVFVYTFFLTAFCAMYLHYNLKNQVTKKILFMKLLYLNKMKIMLINKTIYLEQDLGTIIKMLFHYLQIFCSSINLNSQLPFTLNFIVQVGGDPAKFTFSSFDCLFKNSVLPMLWLNRLLLQLFIIFTITILLIFSRQFVDKFQRKFHRRQFYLVFIYLFYYSSIAKIFISLCFCQKIGQNYYMRNDYMQQCWVENYIILLIGLIYPLTIIWCFLIPYILFKVMQAAQKSKKNKKISYILSFYFVQQGYQAKSYYWEIIKMLQKCIIMIILNINISSTTQLLLILGICFLYLQMVSAIQPFQKRYIQKLEIFLQQIIILSLLLWCIISFSNNEASQLLITLIIMLLNLTALAKIIIIYLRLTSIRQKIYQTKISKLLFKCRLFKQQTVSIQRVSNLWLKVYKFIFKNNIKQLKTQKNKVTLTGQFTIQSPICSDQDILNPQIDKYNL